MKLFGLLLIAFCSVGNAKQWSRDEYFSFRKAIEINDSELARAQVASKEKYVLPVSPGYDQGGSGICWVYATLNAVESNYLVRNPQRAPALSRAVMQYFNMEDRFLRQILLGEYYVDNEGGTPVNAISIMRNSGVYWLTDYRDYPLTTNWTNPFPLSHDGSISARIQQMYKGLASVYGVPPTNTHTLDGNYEIPPRRLADEFLGDETWRAYAPPWDELVTETPTGWGVHPDPDARKGTLAYYLSTEAEFISIIHSALKSGHALTVAWQGHEEEIYGAEFDGAGKVTVLYFKGSYGPDFTYNTTADVLHRMVAVSTVSVGP